MRARPVALALLLSLSACAGDEYDEEPTVGVVWANGQVGYGEVAPAEIHNGGVPTGSVFDIAWESWGGDTAIGNGTGYFAPIGGGSAESRPEPALVIAFDLGECDGRLAYRQVRWFFMAQGDEVDLDGDRWYDICTPYVP